jgi:acyl carrier protein
LPRPIGVVVEQAVKVAETPDGPTMRYRIKRLIVENLHLDGLRPDMIDEDAPLFGDGLGLDSVDALELVVALEKEFGIKIKSNEMDRQAFSSVAALSRFVEGRTTPHLP